mmetsp:Transcript_41292/g.39769  ORF Transcript_41292/g.39769 Transcript_41292/m.39769 type:complete len:142 (-) Transcript_41292:557-982(-)
MSEHIESSLNRLNKKSGAFTYNPKSSSIMLEKKEGGIAPPTKFEVVREKILELNKKDHIISYKKVYDKAFREFKEKLVQEYALMRASYLTEYESNYHSNLKDKDQKIEDALNLIREKEDELVIRDGNKKNKINVMGGLFDE